MIARNQHVFEDGATKTVPYGIEDAEFKHLVKMHGDLVEIKILGLFEPADLSHEVSSDGKL